MNGTQGAMERRESDMPTGSAVGDIRLFAGSASQELAQEIGDYLSVPLSGYDLVEYSNQNLFIRLHGSVRGQDVFKLSAIHNFPCRIRFGHDFLNPRI